MYDVTVKNDYGYPIALDYPVANNQAQLAGLGDKIISKSRGNHILSVPGIEPINFIDITDTQPSEYTFGNTFCLQPQWVNLVRCCDLDAHFRYEGQGEVIVDYDPHGCSHLSFTKGGMVIN
ncbi:hypothetical protein [Kangiella koreensis]|uniref:Uncharacterized protein n=1 Tax=Kangiella koreensis (strain DSM 16069 / JCM 12317 / KCTC 12182 / SW-125) TaxID=523791 RepID=C7R9Z6_KANKD|nr:hypothetical protein [Kangiella koreensis]ACV28015.1 hypothetical protein Kkor_2607 [Kangiella koreensis DSM 16069]